MASITAKCAALLLLCAGTLHHAALAENRPHQLRIMTYNVRGGMGIEGVRNYDHAADVIRQCQPDICALQELDSMTARNGQTDALQEYARRCGMYGTFARAIEYDGGAYGIGLLSREKPDTIKRIPLPGREERRVLLVAEFPDYVFLATHLSLTEADQLTSIRMIDSVAGLYPHKAVYLAGDMNFTPDSEPCRHLCQTFVPLNDTTQCSWPADNPRDAIDYIWGHVGAGHKYRVLEREVVHAPSQSDHRPVFCRVRYRP